MASSEGDTFVVSLSKPMGIQIAETPHGPVIAVIDDAKSGGSCHQWNLTADDSDKSKHSVAVGDYIKAVSNTKGKLVPLAGKKIHEVMDLIDRAGSPVQLELHHPHTTTSDTELVKEKIATAAADRLQKADRFKVTLSKPLGIKVGESEDGVIIAQIEKKGAAIDWNKLAETDEFSHNIAVGDVILAISNKKGDMVSLRDLPMDKVVDVFAKTDRTVKLDFARFKDATTDTTAVKRMISRHNTRSQMSKQQTEEEEEWNDSDKYSCEGFDHPAGAIVDVYPISCCVIGTLLGPCGVYYGLTHGMKQCRRCDAIWSAAPESKADPRHIRAVNS